MFYYGDATISFKLFHEGHFHTHIGHQIISRYIAKTEFLLGLFETLADEQNAGMESLSIANVSKIMTMLENFKALRLASETSAELDAQGILIPSSSPLLAANVQFPPFYLEVINMLQLLGSSGIIMTPMKDDLSSEPGPYVNQYLKGHTSDAKDRIALFRMVWELTAGPFGGRQSQFERFFFGSAQTVHNRMYNSYDNHEDYRQLVQTFLAQQDT